MKQTIKGIVSKKIWGPDDSYLTVEVQVDANIFKSMEDVMVTVEQL